MTCKFILGLRLQWISSRRSWVAFVNIYICGFQFHPCSSFDSISYHGECLFPRWSCPRMYFTILEAHFGKSSCCWEFLLIPERWPYSPISETFSEERFPCSPWALALDMALGVLLRSWFSFYKTGGGSLLHSLLVTVIGPILNKSLSFPHLIFSFPGLLWEWVSAVHNVDLEGTGSDPETLTGHGVINGGYWWDKFSSEYLKTSETAYVPLEELFPPWDSLGPLFFLTEQNKYL